MRRLRNVALVCFFVLGVRLAIAGQSSDRAVRKMQNPGVTLSISMPSSTISVGEDTQIHVALTNESAQEVRPSFYGLPIDVLHFSVRNANGKRLGCDPPVVMQVGAMPLTRALPAGRALNFVVSLKTWQCPGLPVGKYSVEAFWDLDDLDQHIQSSIPVRIPSNVLSFSIATPVARVNNPPPLTVAEIEGLIRVFSASRQSDDFKAFLEGIQRPFYTRYPPQHTGVNNLSQVPPSAETIKLWLEMYAALDSVETQTSKDVKPAYTHVSPPTGAGLFPVDPAPSEISDPVLREEYEAKIAENERNRLAANNASDIRSQRMAASSFFWVWANGMYINDPSSQTSIEKEATSLGCLPARVQWIKTIVSRRGFPPDESLIARQLSQGESPRRN
jgi:hypothetical protein